MKKILKKLLKPLYYNFLYYVFLYAGYVFSTAKKKYVIAGSTETAGVLASFKEIYGDNVFSYSRINLVNCNYHYDLCINSNRIFDIIRLPYIFGKLVKKAKAFIYFGGTPYSSNDYYFKEKELSFIKSKKIPIIEVFLGSEIRSPVLFKEKAELENRNTYYDYIPNNIIEMERIAKKNAELADKYASLIFSHKNDQISYLKSKQLFFPPVFEQKKIHNCMQKFDNLNTIKILHAPSNPNVKGTPVVRAVVKKLKQEGYNFEYKELMGLNNSVVIEELQSSHIVLNQFYLLIPGIFGLEAMANCNAVLMSAKPEEFPYEFNDAWMQTTDCQLYDNLKYLLDNPKEIKRFAENGFRYLNFNFGKDKLRDYLDAFFLEYMK